jgi:hypothetical protein
MARGEHWRGQGSCPREKRKWSEQPDKGGTLRRNKAARLNGHRQLIQHRLGQSRQGQEVADARSLVGWLLRYTAAGGAVVIESSLRDGSAGRGELSIRVERRQKRGLREQLSQRPRRRLQRRRGSDVDA